jgi:hypothetical protein
VRVNTGGRTDRDGNHLIAVRRRIDPSARHARSSTRAIGVDLNDSGRAHRAGASTGRPQRPLPVSPRNPRDA